MVTVSRWGGSPDHRVFVEESDAEDDGRRLVRGNGRFVWVTPGSQPPDQRSLGTTLVAMTTFWVARLLEHGWFYIPDTEEVAIELLVTFEEQAGPALAVAPSATGIRLVVLPGFVHALCREDDSADRMLLLALVRWWLPLPTERCMRMVDAISPPAEAATFTMWSQPDARSLSRGPDPPPSIPDHLRRRVAIEVAARFVGAQQIVVIQDDQVLPRLDALIGALVALLEQELDELGPDAVIEFVALQERALAQEQREEIFLPARIAMPGLEAVMGEPESAVGLGLALRALVDRLAARPPAGSSAPSLERITLIRAYARKRSSNGDPRATRCEPASPNFG